MTLTVYVQGTIWAKECFSNCWCNSCPPELQGRIFLWSAFSEIPTSLGLAAAPAGILYLKSSRSSTCVSFALSFFSSGFGRRAEQEGLRAGGMPPALFSELSGSAAGARREKAGRQGVGMMGWVESVSCCYALGKGRVVVLLWLMLEEAFWVRSLLLGRLCL